MKFLIFCILIGILSCRSSEVREIDMDNSLEEELRAEPDVFKDSKIQKVNGKDTFSKNKKK